MNGVLWLYAWYQPAMKGAHFTAEILWGADATP